MGTGFAEEESDEETAARADVAGSTPSSTRASGLCWCKRVSNRLRSATVIRVHGSVFLWMCATKGLVAGEAGATVEEVAGTREVVIVIITRGAAILFVSWGWGPHLGSVGEGIK